jgi:hypothetical protein
MYSTTNQHGYERLASSIDGALCYAVLFIYIGEKTRQDVIQTLKQGKKATISYGFNTVTIEPVDEYCLGDERYYANE